QQRPDETQRAETVEDPRPPPVAYYPHREREGDHNSEINAGNVKCDYTTALWSGYPTRDHAVQGWRRHSFPDPQADPGGKHKRNRISEWRHKSGKRPPHYCPAHNALTAKTVRQPTAG